MFNHPFREVAREYLSTQEARAKRGEISAARPKKLRAVTEGTLDRYAGSSHLATNGGVAILPGGERTGLDVINATAFVTSQLLLHNRSQTRSHRAAPRFNRKKGSES